MAPRYGGQKIPRGALYLMLQNRIYRGEITHKGVPIRETSPSSSSPVGDDVQAVLAKNRVDRQQERNRKHPPVGGLVF